MGKKEQIFDLALVAAQATRLDLFLRNEAVYPREKALVEWVPTYVGFWIGTNNKMDFVLWVHFLPSNVIQNDTPSNSCPYHNLSIITRYIIHH